ncbi:NAD(P)-binding domain-containing protein [Streptosporangium sp. NPDC048047]|uniref:NAD(P)-dependent oxidoreductase n=1 Tax=Streptosporangium sp. NPDC048047 TaxID=3155748 RepID=UPI00342CBF7F
MTMTMDNDAPVTVLGLGAMGTALAGAFLNAGRRVTVWNRTASRAEPLVARGAALAATAADATAASPLVVVCLLNDDTVREVLGGAAGSLAGRTVVNLTNGTPRQARETAAWTAGHGAGYVDGGIMAIPPMIGTPGSLVFYSGSPEGFHAHERTLGALGRAMYLGEDAGRAALYDIALLSAMYGMFGGFFHALALTGSEKVPASEFTPLVTPWLTAMMTSLPRMAEAIDSGDHSASASNLAMQATGYVNLLDASAEQGVSTELVEPMRALLDRGVAAGLGAGDVSALVDLLYSAPAGATGAKEGE